MTTPTYKGRRNFFWYVKFIFACYAAGFAAAMLLLLISMPLGSLAWLTERRFGIDPRGVAILVFGAAFAPVIWRRLR
jgi:hypothetical protein